MLAFALAHVESSRMPQVAKGGDALSVAFADAKAVLSAAMVHKADSYFHGGIDMECHERPGHEHHHDHHEEHGADGETDHADPWSWINRHVRAPERHVHLEGSGAVELMPWFWASVRADPHNIDAWTTAWYVANSMIKDRELARRIIAEAREKNPNNLEIVWTEARFVYDEGRGDAAAAERLLNEGRDICRALCGGDLSGLSAHDAEVYCYMLDLLSKICERRGDRAAIRPLVDEVRATGAKTPVEGWMLQRLR